MKDHDVDIQFVYGGTIANITMIRSLLASYEAYGEQGSTELKEKVLKLLGEHG